MPMVVLFSLSMFDLKRNDFLKNRCWGGEFRISIKFLKYLFAIERQISCYYITEKEIIQVISIEEN